MEFIISNKKTIIKFGPAIGVLLLAALVNPGWFLLGDNPVSGGFVVSAEDLTSIDREPTNGQHAYEAPLFHEARVPYQPPKEIIVAAEVQLSPVPFALSGIVVSGDGTMWAYLTNVSSNEANRVSEGMIVENWTILEVGEDFVRIGQDTREEILRAGDTHPDADQTTGSNARKRN